MDYGSVSRTLDGNIFEAGGDRAGGEDDGECEG